MPDKNKEAPKAIYDRTTPDANAEAQQTLNKGSKGMGQMDVNFDQKGKREFSTSGLEGLSLSKLFGSTGGRLLAIRLAYFQRWPPSKSASI